MKKEFIARLLRLHDAINDAIYYDSPDRGLLPALASVFVYLWCKSVDDLINHNKRSLKYE